MSIGRVPGVTGIQPSIVDAKGDLIVATAADSVDRLAVGTNEQRLVADSAAATGLKYVADTTNYAIAAKGDLLVGTAADTLQALSVGTNGYTLVADSAETTGLKWAAAAGGGANWTLENSGGTALTGAATITISGISGKDKIMVLISEASSANSDAYIGVRLNGVTSSSYYGYGILNVGNSTYAATNFATDTGAATYVPVAQTSGSAGGQVNGYVLFTGCNASGVKVLQSVGGSNASGSSGHKQLILGGYFNSSDLITSVSLFSASGNFDAGTVYVYTSA